MTKRELRRLIKEMRDAEKAYNDAIEVRIDAHNREDECLEAEKLATDKLAAAILDYGSPVTLDGKLYQVDRYTDGDPDLCVCDVAQL